MMQLSASYCGASRESGDVCRRNDVAQHWLSNPLDATQAPIQDEDEDRNTTAEPLHEET